MNKEDKYKKLFIHIGAHKTGTTAIQKFLSMNRELLKEQGCLYPGSADSHYRLTRELRDHTSGDPDSEAREVADELKQNYHKYHTFILSSEGFWEIVPKRKIEEVRDYIQNTGLNFDIRILFFYRDQDSWLESAYQQQVKQVNIRSVKTFREFINRKTFFVTIDYFNLLTNWSDVFGPDSIVAMNYKDFKENNDLFDEFCDLVGLENRQGMKKPPLSSSNVGLRPESIEFLRYLNLLSINNKDFVKTVDLLSEIEERPIGRYYFLNHEDQNFIRGYFEKSNTSLAKYFLKCPPEQLIKSSQLRSDAKSINQSEIDWGSLSLISKYLSIKDKSLFLRICDEITKQKPGNKEAAEFQKNIINEASGLSMPEKSNNRKNAGMTDHHKKEVEEEFNRGNFVLRIDPQNFADSIKQLSNDIKLGIFPEKNFTRIVSKGPDPYFVIKPVKTKISNGLIFKIHIIAPVDTVFELFYQTLNDNSFSKELSIREIIMKGDNLFYVKLNNKNLNGNFRVDPGVHKGKYLIYDIEAHGIKQ